MLLIDRVVDLWQWEHITIKHGKFRSCQRYHGSHGGQNPTQKQAGSNGSSFIHQALLKDIQANSALNPIQKLVNKVS